MIHDDNEDEDDDNDDDDDDKGSRKKKCLISFRIKCYSATKSEHSGSLWVSNWSSLIIMINLMMIKIKLNLLAQEWAREIEEKKTFTLYY